jgi:DNA-directed RNA polymerase beta subunit
LNIINPNLKIQNEDWNIFTFRQKDYEQLLEGVKQIVKPVEEIGFQITEIDLKDSRFSSGELSKTIKQTLVIKIKKGTHEIDLSMFIPKLIDGNYIYINGRKKIPLFQLFDIPIVTRGETIKFRSNVATIMIIKEKELPKVHMTFLSKKVTLALILLAYYGQDECIKRFDLNSKIDKESENLYELLRYDLKLYIEESKGLTQDDFIMELGRHYSKYAAKSKGEDIIYGLGLIPKVDIMTAKFLTKPTVLEEIIEILKTGYLDDTLLINKRVRCFEYIVLGKVSKIIFDLCMANRTSRQPKFNINSTQILSECNVSDIVQFDFSINPIHELTMLSRSSLLGPGGFKRENIPKHLRDICPTMFGRICPVDTPDRDNCGVLQNLVANVDVDDEMKFTDKICDKQPFSIPVSMVPFLKNDDQTRLQMSSSQMRQAIMLKEFEQSLIRSGCENLYTDKTQFVKRAKKDGVVIHVDNDFILVMYDDKTPDIFNISYRKIYVEHLDFLTVYVKEGDKFKAGEILAESNFCKDGVINIGRNLLTGVMVYYGNNYEDGIVISDRLANEDILTSVHFKDLSFTITPDKVLLSLDDNKYKPLPVQFEKINALSPYAILKKINSEEPTGVFSEPVILDTKKDILISEVNVYANEWNTDIKQYSDWIKKKIEEQQNKEQYFQNILKEHFSKEDALRIIRENSLDKFSFGGKYKQKREKILGVQVEMFGIHFRKVKVGDKMANRHGNKGVISRIVPQDKMPQLEDGRHLDICINPLGIISRMNIGQLYELHLAMSVNDLKLNMLKMLDENKSQEEIKKYLIDYIAIVDKTENNWYSSQLIEQMPEIIDEDFINDFTLIQAPFESCELEDVRKALQYTGSKFKYKVFDPLSKEMLMNEIAVGYIYFFRMVHIADEKLAARGIGAYARRTLQPLGGRKNKGGQRCGEMETACLIGHDAPHNLFEFLTTKSDCIDLKNNYIRNFIESSLFDPSIELDTVPESVKLLNSYLTVIGVNHK